jgi:hypothetical protein
MISRLTNAKFMKNLPPLWLHGSREGRKRQASRAQAPTDWGRSIHGFAKLDAPESDEKGRLAQVRYPP